MSNNSKIILIDGNSPTYCAFYTSDHVNREFVSGGEAWYTNPVMSRNGLKKTIAKVVNDAVEKIKPEKVILFGSYAYGKPNKDSDVDLLFIKDTTLSGLKRYSWATQFIEHLFPMDILIKTPAEVKKRLRMGDPFYHEIINKGRLLYDSSK